MLHAHKQLTAAILLPHTDVHKFNGNLMEYRKFILAFEARILPHTSCDSDKLHYLYQHLDGQPKKLIEGCTYMDPSQGYTNARELLQTHYGDPYKVSAAYIDTILSWPPTKADDDKALRDFALFLITCDNAMQAVSHLEVLNHAPNMQAVLTKLPTYLQDKWRDFVSSPHRQDADASFSMLVQFVEKAADAANHTVYSREALTKATRYSTNHNNTAQMPIANFAIKIDNTDCHSDITSACYLCKRAHTLNSCPQFKSMTFDDRRAYIIDTRLCFGCLNPNHTSKDCTNKQRCDICGKRHPTTLHEENFRRTETVYSKRLHRS
jgi:hypothetical protein